MGLAGRRVSAWTMGAVGCPVGRAGVVQAGLGLGGTAVSVKVTTLGKLLLISVTAGFMYCVPGAFAEMPQGLSPVVVQPLLKLA